MSRASQELLGGPGDGTAAGASICPPGGSEERRRLARAARHDRASASERRQRLLFYCQHSLGLGHLARSLRLAAALARAVDVVLLNGGRFPPGTQIPAGIDVVNLAPLGHDEAFKLISHDPALSVEEAKRLRRTAVLDALDRTSPDVVLIEMYPFGRRKFEFELLPLLDAAARPGGPRVVCSLRDILVNQRRDQAAYDDRVCERANRYFDAILVHSDPAFARLEDSFSPTTPLKVPVHYTGFVAPPAMTSDQIDRMPRLLVSSGGGMVGEPLVRAAVGVHRELAERTGLTTTVVAGPFLPDPAWEWLRAQAAGSPALEAVRRVDDLCQEMHRSALSLSQGGYNTTMDILRAGTPALIVPFAEGAEGEQTRRVDRLAALGLVRTVPAAELRADRLLAELTAAASQRPVASGLDLSGAETTARLVADLSSVGTSKRDGGQTEGCKAGGGVRSVPTGDRHSGRIDEPSVRSTG